jgi:DNA sulfur modification protein DndD
MKLISLTMNNFRQFYGESIIEFSRYSDRSVSIIHGENGVGKTTILNALYWCFYGQILEDFEQKESLVNNYSRSMNNTATCQVEVQFEEAGLVYRIVRFYDQDKKMTRAEGFQISNGNSMPISGIDAVVRRIIPIDMAPYFFFHGEGLNHLGKGQNRAGAIRAILGFNHGDTAMRALQSIKLKWQKQSDKLGRLDQQARESIEQEILAQENFNEANEKHEKAKVNLTVVEEQLAAINEELATIKVQNIDKLNEKRQKIESRQRSIPRELEELQEQRVRHISRYGWSIFGHSFLVDGAEKLSQYRSSRKIPAEFNDIFVQSLLNHGVCICGTELKVESHARQMVEAMLAGASTSDQEDAMIKATVIADGITNLSDEYISKINQLALAEEALIKEQGDNERKLEEINEKISGVDQPRITLLETERSDLTDVATRLRDLKYLCKIDMDKARAAREEARRKKDKSVDKDKLGSYQQRLDYIDELITRAESVIREEEETARDEIQVLINDRLSKFSRKDYFAEVGYDFSFELKMQNGAPVAKSKGERALLNLAFMAALIELARTRFGAESSYFVQGTIAPFVIDAPFGELDNQYRGAVAAFLPESTEQLVVLLSSSHWGEIVEKNIRPKIGKEYILVSESTQLESDDNVKDDLVIAGATYQCAKYGMPIPKSSIEEIEL